MSATRKLHHRGLRAGSGGMGSSSGGTCVAANLLNPVGGAGPHRATRSAAGLQLAVVADSVVQSAAGVFREMARRAAASSCTTVLVCLLRGSEVYLEPTAQSCTTVLDYHTHVPGYSEQPISIDTLASAVCDAVTKTSSTARVTVIIDSLDALLDKTECDVPSAYAALQRLAMALPAASRLVVGAHVDGTAAGSSLAGLLCSPLFWSQQRSDDAATAPAHALITARIHPASLFRYLHKTYALAPPSSSAAVFRAAGSETPDGQPALAEAGDAPVGSDAHAHFWSVLHTVSGRGPLGIRNATLGTPAGWWCSAVEGVEHARPPLHALDTAAVHTRRTAHKLTLDELVGKDAAPRGVGVLELHQLSSTGKVADEVTGCACEALSGGRGGTWLRLLALDTSECTEQAPAPTPAPAGPDPHTSMLQSLPFNLGETQIQRERREQVPLPYAYHQQARGQAAGQSQTGAHTSIPSGAAWRGTTGKSAIFFEPESEDDEDEEDPDEDLDV